MTLSSFRASVSVRDLSTNKLGRFRDINAAKHAQQNIFRDLSAAQHSSAIFLTYRPRALSLRFDKSFKLKEKGLLIHQWQSLHGSVCPNSSYFAHPAPISAGTPTTAPFFELDPICTIEIEGRREPGSKTGLPISNYFPNV
jgi:hypothetical protein